MLSSTLFTLPAQEPLHTALHMLVFSRLQPVQWNQCARFAGLLLLISFTQPCPISSVNSLFTDGLFCSEPANFHLGTKGVKILLCGLFISSQRKRGPPLLLSALLTSLGCPICALPDQGSLCFPIHFCSSVVPLHQVCGALSIFHVHISGQVHHGTCGYYLILSTSSVH